MSSAPPISEHNDANGDVENERRSFSETESFIENERALAQERSGDDRRSVERRREPRRHAEFRQVRQVRNFGRLSTLAAGLGAAIGIFALINAPVSRSATACTDSLGGELLHHREIHPLWVAAMILAAVALALPSRPKRSYVSVGLVGLTFGLAVAAYLRVATWKTGICFV
jgi:hypothetical protein